MSLRRSTSRRSVWRCTRCCSTPTAARSSSTCGTPPARRSSAASATVPHHTLRPMPRTAFCWKNSHACRQAWPRTGAAMHPASPAAPAASLCGRSQQRPKRKPRSCLDDCLTAARPLPRLLHPGQLRHHHVRCDCAHDLQERAQLAPRHRACLRDHPDRALRQQGAPPAQFAGARVLFWSNC